MKRLGNCILLIAISALILGCGSNISNQKESSKLETPTEIPILVSKPTETTNSFTSEKIETLEDFELSEFYKSYKLYSDGGWELKEGGYNNLFETASLPDISFEVVTMDKTINEFGIIFYERDILQDSELNFVYELLQSIDKKIEVNSTIKEYIKTNSERNVAQIKQANSTTFGKLRIYAGKVGSDQTIHIEKL